MNTTVEPVGPSSPPVLSRWRIWFQAVRFFSFTASVIPITVGSALALVDGRFTFWLFATMVIAAVACHAGANLANDYFDHEKGIDTLASLGPSKVIQQHLLSPAEVKRGMVVSFAVATLLGLVVVYESGWQILALAIASLAVAYLYTGGPKPLAYIGLGEIAVFFFMGPVMVCGAYYVLTNSLTDEAVVISLPIACLVAAILHANNIRDIDLDRSAGKVTLVTKFGRRFANYEYAALVGFAYLFVIAAIWIDVDNWPLLIAMTTLPVAVSLTRSVMADTGPTELNHILRKTAGLHLRLGSLVTFGLIIRWLSEVHL